jgi:DNA-binding transcriptional ArsR family regulator
VATYQARDGWEALGDPSRLAIVTALAERPQAVGELADALPISRPAVSQVGTRRVYRLNPVGMAALRDQLETFWNRALESYQDVVEENSEEQS